MFFNKKNVSATENSSFQGVAVENSVLQELTEEQLTQVSGGKAAPWGPWHPWFHHRWGGGWGGDGWGGGGGWGGGDWGDGGGGDGIWGC